MSELTRQSLLLPGEPTPARQAASFLPERRPSLLPSRLPAVSTGAPLGVQTQLTVGRPDDEYEREADRVADAVMRMPDPQPHASGLAAPSPRLQRRCAECEDKVQRQEMSEPEEDEDMLEAKALPGQTPTVSPTTQARIRSLKAGGRPLDAGLRRFFEPRFGHDFAGVRIHTGPRAAETAREVRAKAFTVGRHIVFGASDYAPSTTAGRELLAHELTHVVQQTGGRRRSDGSEAT